MSKVLIPIHENLADSVYTVTGVNFAKEICFVHGYDYDVVPISQNSTLHQDLSDYEFCLVPSVTQYGSWNVNHPISNYFDGSISIPSFVLSLRDETDKATTKTQVSSVGGIATRKMYWGSVEVYTYGYTYQENSGANITPIITENSDGTGSLYAYRLNGDNSNVYFEGSRIQLGTYGVGQGFENHSLFPILLQEAINNNDVSTPRRKSISCFDLDDFPEADNTLEEVQALVDVVNDGGLHLLVGVIPPDNPGNDVWELLEENNNATHPSKYLHFIVHHPSQHMDDTRSNIQDEMDASITTIKSRGLSISKYHAPAWYYPNNRFNTDTLDLQSAEYSITQDEDLTTPKKGWGTLTARSESGLFETYGENVPESQQKLSEYTYYKGIRILGSKSALGGSIEPDTSTEITKFSVMSSEWIAGCMYGGHISYIHGDDLYNDPANSQYATGLRWLEKVVAIAKLLPDVHEFSTPDKFWFHPMLACTIEESTTDIVNNVDVTLGNTQTLETTLQIPLPSNTSLPTLSNTSPVKGQEITVTNGTWDSLTTPQYTYQWKRDGENISGANSNSYTLSESDVDSLISCDVTATNISGSSTISTAQTSAVLDAIYPVSIIGNSDSAIVWDLVDTETLFQDYRTQTSVSSAGDPVGLILSKDKKLERSSELNDNTWPSSSGSGITDNGEGNYTLTSASGDVDLSDNTIVTEGKVYEFTYTIEVGSDDVSVYHGASVPITKSPGTYTEISYCTLENIIFRVSTGETATISGISVKEILGNHLAQPTSSKRPVYRLDTNGNPYLDFDGVDDEIGNLTGISGDNITIAMGYNYQPLGDGIIAANRLSANDINTFVNENNELRGSYYNGSSWIASEKNSDAVGYAENKFVLAYLDKGGTPSYDLEINNSAQTGTGSAGLTTTSTGFHLGGDGGSYLDGNIYSGMIINRELTSVEKTNLEEWSEVAGTLLGSSTDLIISVDTSITNVGTNSSTEFKIGISSVSTYDCRVYWGDGTYDDITLTGDSAWLHDYGQTYIGDIIIVGHFGGFGFGGGDGEDRIKLTSVKQWGATKFDNFQVSFFGCSNLNVAATDSPDLSNVTSMNRAFRSTGTGNWTGDISGWDVSNVEDFDAMFYGSTQFNQDLSNWDVSLGKDFSNMFFSANMPFDITGWNMSSAQNISGMFRRTDFDQDISGWNITSVTNATLLFDDSNLPSIIWDKILVSWGAQAVQNNVVIDGDSAYYGSIAAKDARAALIADHSWTITDAGYLRDAIAAMTGVQVIFDFTDPDTLYTDEAKTTLVTAVNDPVAVAVDVVNFNEIAISSGETTRRPLYKTTGLQGDGTDDTLHNETLTNGVASPPYSVATGVKMINYANNQGAINWGTGLGVKTDDITTPQDIIIGLPQNIYERPFDTNYTRYIVVSDILYGGSEIQIDGVDQGAIGVPNQGGAEGLILFGYGGFVDNNAYIGEAKVSAYVLFDKHISNINEMSLIDEWLEIIGEE